MSAILRNWRNQVRARTARRSSCRHTLIGVLEHLTECRRRGELPAPETQQESDPFHLLSPVDDFLVLCIHVLTEVEQNSMLPAGNGFAGWMTELD